VHSSNRSVMQGILNAPFSCVTTVFHAQANDFKRENGFGTFFTNVAARPCFKPWDLAPDTPCTDLSTARVDKGVFALWPGTCVIFVTNAAAMLGKLSGLCRGPQPRPGAR